MSDTISKNLSDVVLELSEINKKLQKQLEDLSLSFLKMTSPDMSTSFMVLSITTAYEQGVGKGQQYSKEGRGSKNPYIDHVHREAWQLGYEEGITLSKV